MLICLGSDDSKFARIGHILRSSSIMKYSMHANVKISVRTVLEIATSPRKILDITFGMVICSIIVDVRPTPDCFQFTFEI